MHSAMLCALPARWGGPVFNCSIPHRFLWSNISIVLPARPLLSVRSIASCAATIVVGKNTDGQGFLPALRTVAAPASVLSSVAITKLTNLNAHSFKSPFSRMVKVALVDAQHDFRSRNVGRQAMQGEQYAFIHTGMTDQPIHNRIV